MTPMLLSRLDELIAALRADGRTVIGPTVRDGAIVLDEIAQATDLPYGWATDTDAGTYRLRRHTDRAAFVHTAGPQSWKRFLQPPRERLWAGDRTDDGFEVTDAPEHPRSDPEPQRLAFLGVRPCDLRAIGILDRVLGDGRRYAARRDGVFVVAVNCTEPGAACFCVSAGGWPAVSPRRPDPARQAGTTGYDVVLTERANGTCLAEAASAAGEALLAKLDAVPATPDDVAAVDADIAEGATRMGRALPPGDLRTLLTQRREDPHWEDVAQRCLACGNCTLVCPTCFCTTVEDTTDLTGDHAARWQRWDSCFDLDFSYMHGGSARTSTASRYRQWLSHKFGTWHDQFGESGCVGCGRCIVWCPVGIDVTAELAALAASGTEREGPS